MIFVLKRRIGEIMDNPACDEIAKLINNTFDIYLKTYWVKQHVTTWWQIQWFQADWAPDLYCICIVYLLSKINCQFCPRIVNGDPPII